MADKSCWLHIPHPEVGPIEIYESGLCWECYIWVAESGVVAEDASEKEIKEAYAKEQKRMEKEEQEHIAVCKACRDGLPHGPEHIPADNEIYLDPILSPSSEYARSGSIVHTILTDQGWHHGQTGGGCTAYSKETHDPEHQGHPEGWYWLLTDSMDPTAPTRANQMVTLGLYDHNGTPIIDFTVKLSLILYGELVVEDTYA